MFYKDSEKIEHCVGYGLEKVLEGLEEIGEAIVEQVEEAVQDVAENVQQVLDYFLPESDSK